MPIAQPPINAIRPPFAEFAFRHATTGTDRRRSGPERSHLFAALERIGHLVTARDGFDEPDRLLDGGRGVVLQPEGQGEVEQHFGVGLAPNLGI